jgi:hypothetical protein
MTTTISKTAAPRNTAPAPVRKVSAVLGWFPTTPATEREVIDMANSRQVALRTRLRHHYWLTECKPISETTVAIARRKLLLIDPQDTMTDDQVAELLSPHYGFERTAGGWVIPDLDEARGVAVGSIEGIKERAAAAGRASAAKRAGRAVVPESVETATAASADEDF